MKPYYRFLHRGGDRYYWEGPRIDSRVEQVSCNVDWFWNAQRPLEGGNPEGPSRSRDRSAEATGGSVEA